MNCPFRKQVITSYRENQTLSEEFYMPCMKEDCPYYM